MSESSKVWQPIRRNATEHWMRIEDRVRSGTPDCLVLKRTGAVCWVELKWLQRWPARKTTCVPIGLSASQVRFLKNWHKRGGRCWLILRVAEEWLLIPGSRVERTLTENEWKKRAILLRKDSELCLSEIERII